MKDREGGAINTADDAESWFRKTHKEPEPESKKLGFLSGLAIGFWIGFFAGLISLALT